MIDRPFLDLYFDPVNVQKVVVLHIEVVRRGLGSPWDIVSRCLKHVHTFFQVEEPVVPDCDVGGHALVNQNAGARSAGIQRKGEYRRTRVSVAKAVVFNSYVA